MKRYILDFLAITGLFLIISCNIRAQEWRPSITKKVYTRENGSSFVEDKVYLDGFGREIQKIQVKGSPKTNTDIVTPIEYGAHGRVEKSYLPYVKTGNNGAFVNNPTASTNWATFDAADRPYAFSLTQYDNSPMDRVVKQTGPGANWQTAGKGVTTEYLFNAANVVRLLTVNDNNALVANGYHAANTLQMVRITDEDGNKSETYTDALGQTLLTVTYDGTAAHHTYMVYDYRGMLRYVLSPECSATCFNGNSVNTTIVEQLGYYYRYDNWGRNIIKRLPGCSPVYMVYDKKDRLVMSQDGNQRTASPVKWSYTLYDNRNRPVETGEVANSSTHDALRTAAGGSLNYVPTGTRTPLQFTLYNNYTATSNVPVHAFVATSGYSSTYHTMTTGLVTSVRTRILDENTWITTTTYYDDRCRVIQTVSDNVQGGISRVDHVYDFVGNVLKSRESHSGSAGTNVVETINTYDDRGRLLTSNTRLNNGNPATLKYGYDDIGRLVSKTYGTGVTETLAYNIRGWLTSKVSPKFSMKLRYETTSHGSTTKRYNGNISEWEWKHDGASTSLMYGFSYDGLNRLRASNYYQGSGTSWTSVNHFNENGITYDRNGNIKTLARTANGTTVDNLAYSYVGNQLRSLTESVSGNREDDIFIQGGTAAGTYGYDVNGNMVSDSRKAITLGYNTLNLVKDVKSGGVVKAKYYYLADGAKLRVRDGTGTNGFDYIGSLTFTQSSAGLKLEAANFGDFRIVASGTTNSVQYNLTDHLGSVRVIVNSSGGILEKNDYYPFGARHFTSGYIVSQTGNRFKFNGKEEQTTGALKYLDYGWRNYDYTLGRWFGMDACSEYYTNLSPYNFTVNNPINLIDPNGMWVETSIGYITNKKSEISNFMSAFRFENSIRNDDWSGFSNWAINFALDDTYNRPLWLSDGSLFWPLLSEVNVISSGSSSFVTLASMQRWCDEMGASKGIPNYFEQSIGYLLSNKSLLSMDDKQTLFNRGIIGRKEFMEHPMTQIVGGAMLSMVTVGIGGTYMGAARISGGLYNTAPKGAYSVYRGLDTAGQVRYVGITSRNPALRFTEHLNSIGSGKDLLNYRVIRSGLSQTNARILEQSLINKYGMQKSGGMLLNKINSIAPKYWWQYGL